MPDASAGKSKPGQSFGLTLWLAGLSGIAAIIFASSSVVLGAILLLPTAMAWIADIEPGRPAARVVGLFGLAGGCASFDMIWNACDGVEAAIALSADVRNVAIAWAAQAGGWLLTQVLPVLIGAWAEVQAQTKIEMLAQRKVSLLQEWGEIQ